MIESSSDWGQIAFVIQKNMGATPLRGREAAKKLSFSGRQETFCCRRGSSGALKKWTKGSPQQPERQRWR